MSKSRFAMSASYSPRPLFKSVSYLLPVLLLAGCATEYLPPEKNPVVIVAKHDLRLARNPALSDETRAGHYLDAAWGASTTFKTSKSSLKTPFADAPDSRALQIYNESSAELTALLRASTNSKLWAENLVITSTPAPGVQRSYKLHLHPGTAKSVIWSPQYFTSYVPAKKVNEKGIRSHVGTDGFGGSLVGVRKLGNERTPQNPFPSLQGLTAPVTATLDFSKAKTANVPTRDVTITLYNSDKDQTGVVNGTQQPLASDLTAPYAYYSHSGQLWLGLMAAMFAQKYSDDSGLYQTQPYDPDRIPVIFIHGLVSTPAMWLNDENELQADPELRKHYQFWTFWYPTGYPVVYPALHMRQEMVTMEKTFPMPKGCVLISHSLGGLVSQMQVTTTGRAIWNANFKKNADKYYAKVPDNTILKQGLVFKADPNIKRVVFICTPHRGSFLATQWIGMLGTNLIQAPGLLVSKVTETLGASFDTVLGTKGGRFPTSIQSLSPSNPTLRALDTLPIEVPYHTIAGDRGKHDTPYSSDGVVPYWSSHMDLAESELLVPGPHGSQELPQTVAELKRILHQHLDGTKGNGGHPVPQYGDKLWPAAFKDVPLY